jgi:hypothetical protein
LIGDYQFYYPNEFFLFWTYPRPVKRLAVSRSNINSFSNHLKFRIVSKSVSDSIVLTRQQVRFNQVIKPFYPDAENNGLIKPRIMDFNRAVMFDIGGRRLTSPIASSQLVFVAPDLLNSGIPLRRVFINGK